ncbi:hypothetical protein E4T44_07666 [Aureobasidium sp. EXF-8845]|nr:hypothetical protein E4T44_07666 [Aureobasidium sp. EXF-8845]
MKILQAEPVTTTRLDRNTTPTPPQLLPRSARVSPRNVRPCALFVAQDVQSDAIKAASAPAPHTLESLLALSHDDLAKYALDLQNQPSAVPQGGSSASPGEVWTEDKIAERARKTRDVCSTEIRKQMKWQPSCKKGSAKWSFTGIVPHEDVFYKLFRLEKPKKPWKQKAIDMSDFNQAIGAITSTIRYGSLSITGESVKVHWDQDEKTFKLAGTYGL